MGIVCSSGIAGTLYTEINASTVHSFYRVRTAELQWKQLVEGSSRNSQLAEKIQKLDCLIWDEVSMSSRRILELVNMIHLHVNKALDSPRLFNGKCQVCFIKASSCFALQYFSKP